VNLTVSRAGSTAIGWAGGFDGTVDDVLGLQNRAVVGVLDSLGPIVPEGFATTLVPPTQNTEAFADYLQARAFVERWDVKGRLDLSIGLFESAIRRDPGFARAHAGLGEASWRKFFQTSDKAWSDRARESTLEALRLDPQDAGVRYALAVIYKGTGRVPEAMQEARRALRLQSRNDEAHALLGEMLAGTGDIDGGVAELKAAIALRPQFWRHHHDLGFVLYGAGRYAEAAAAFVRVTQLQPDSAWGYQMLGTTYHALGDRVRAREQYLRAIELGDARAYSNLGTLDYEDGRFREAARAFEKALELEPGSPAKHRNLGDVYWRIGGEKGKALQHYRRAAELTREQLRTNPRNAMNVARLAVYEAKLGHHDEAARLSAQAAELSPGNPEVTYRQAVVHALAGRTDDALRALEEAIRQGYSPSLIAGDDDLASLKDEFPRILKNTG
jgi:eukaryotic-like serine/threonine-protein kinase